MSGPSHLDTLMSIFAHRPGLSPPYLQHILSAHAGDLDRACNFILTLSDADLSQPLFSDPDPAPNRPPPRPHASRPDLQPTGIDLSDKVQAERLIDNLKDIVVPALKSQLAGLRFPDLCGEADRVKYSLAGLVLESIKLQPSHVSVDITEDRDVHIVATDVAIAVDVERWTYRLRFPPLRDAGRAHFEFSGVKADIILRVNDRDATLSVVSCICNIAGAISFRANDARLSWLYNTLAPILKNAFKPSLEATLTHAISDGLEQQLHDWASWATDS